MRGRLLQVVAGLSGILLCAIAVAIAGSTTLWRIGRNLADGKSAWGYPRE